MSSESEEDFLSADEGDGEDTVSKDIEEKQNARTTKIKDEMKTKNDDDICDKFTGTKTEAIEEHFPSMSLRDQEGENSKSHIICSITATKPSHEAKVREDKHLEDVSNSNLQLSRKKSTEQLKEPLSNEASLLDRKILSNEIQTQDFPDESITTPTVSKVALKKPREKLGQRLGNRKLGSRITKPLVGISSDEIQNQEKEKKLQEQKVLDYDPLNADPDYLEIQCKTVSANSDEDIPQLEEDSSWGTSWGNWGSTLLTAASTFSKEMTRGVGTVLETMENTIGAPDPTLLAKAVVEEEKTLNDFDSEKLPEQKSNSNLPKDEEKINKPEETQINPGFDLGTISSLVTGVFETASNKVLMGGLDTLEKIGKKTMDIIQEGDPGLRNKRNFLKTSNPNLSLVLREAREKALRERVQNSPLEGNSDGNEGQVSMAHIWDNTEGPVHLEALFLVAKQCQDKSSLLLQNVPPGWLEKLEKRIAQIKEFSTIGEDESSEDIDVTLMNIPTQIQLPIQFNKIITGWPTLQEALNRINIEIYGLGNSDLTSVETDFYKEIAGYVAILIGVCHKAAELALITPDLDGLKLAKQFQRLCCSISTGLEHSTDRVCEAISKSLPASDPKINATITNIYIQVEELNSSLESALIHLNTIIIQTEVKLLLN